MRNVLSNVYVVAALQNYNFLKTSISSSRWSVKTKNMPNIGDEKTPFENVDKFYDFWLVVASSLFQTWRCNLMTFSSNFIFFLFPFNGKHFLCIIYYY